MTRASVTSTMILLLVVVVVVVSSVNAMDLRYRPCTAGEFHRNVEQFCMRIGRDTNLSLSPYGTIVARSSSTTTLIELLEASKSLTGRSVQTQQITKRDSTGEARLLEYLANNSCCTTSCVPTEVLEGICKLIRKK